MYTRAEQAMLGRYFLPFRLVRTAFYAIRTKTAKPGVCVCHNSTLLRCSQNGAPLYIKRAVESVGLIGVHRDV